MKPTTTLTPVSPPTKHLSHIAPSGPVVTAVPCCPDVATFEGSNGARSSYFGFDDKTNMVATVGTDEYWLPPTKAKALPASKEERDGARWISVGIGREAEVEINFAGAFTNACLLNCTYEVIPATIADVTSPAITASGMTFKIKGKAAGEASLKVVCDGKVRGYFHIWCVQPASIMLDVVNVVSAQSVGANYSMAALQQELDEVFRQAVISFNMLDLGTVNMTASGAFTTAEAKHYTPSGDFLDSVVSLQMIELAVKAQLAARKPKPGASGPSLPLPRAGALTLYFYVPMNNSTGTVGSVIVVGQNPAFTFTRNAAEMYNTSAHELGHCLDLVHPNDSSANAVQYPAHHFPTVGNPTVAIPATNTEPAVTAGQVEPNVMSADPLNVMGYWFNFNEAKPMRYRQWKACRRRP